jgi:hypothetical protein
LLTVELFNCCFCHKTCKTRQYLFQVEEACQPAASSGKAVAVPLNQEKKFCLFCGFCEIK